MIHTQKRRFSRINILYHSAWILFRLFGICCGIKHRGVKNIPESGPFILASNHQHNLDPFFLGAWIWRQVHFFAKTELWDNKLVGWIITKMNAFPVKRDTINRSVFPIIKDVFAHNHGLVFFPEGTRGSGEVFLKPKAGIGMLLKQVGVPVPIVPVYLQGTNSLLDCLLRRKQLAIIIGKPIPPEEVSEYLTNKEGYQALANKIMAEITILKKLN